MYVYVQRVLLAYNFHSMHCNNKKGPLLELEKSKPLAQFEVYTGVLSKAYIYIYMYDVRMWVVSARAFGATICIERKRTDFNMGDTDASIFCHIRFL